MEQYVIKGGKPLSGEVEIGGAKNAALAIIAAAIMTDETVIIDNLPNVRDVNVMLGAMAWVLAAMNAGPLDVSTIIKIAFVSMVVAIAAPPIPGSAFAVMPILFSACGTDLSLMPLAVIVASTVGYLLPAMNGFCLQQEVLMSAYKSKMVDEKVMMSKD